MKHISILGGLLAAFVILALVPWSKSNSQDSAPSRAAPIPTWTIPSMAVPAPASTVSAPRAVPAQPKARAQSVEDLIAQLADLKAKKAAIEQTEGEVTALIKERLKQQQNRLQRLGIPAEGGTYGVPIGPAPGYAEPLPPPVQMAPCVSACVPPPAPLPNDRRP